MKPERSVTLRREHIRSRIGFPGITTGVQEGLVMARERIGLAAMVVTRVKMMSCNMFVIVLTCMLTTENQVDWLNVCRWV